MTDLKVALKDLASDADRWADCSKQLKKSAKDVDGLKIDQSAFPGPDIAVDLYDKYTALQAKIAGLLIGGGTQTLDIADELIHVGKIIGGQDEKSRDDIKSSWDYS